MNNLFKIGDAVKVVLGAKNSSGKEVSQWVYETKLFVREYRDDAVVVSKRTSGPITGMFNEADLVDWTEEMEVENDFAPYVVRITADSLDIHVGAGTNFKRSGELKRNYLNTIIGEKDGWGRLKIGGWIDLSKTKKM